jgi:2-oxoglutarate dehydrogenase E2 component (dihydrolipoamide succinyltransferase)
MSVTVTMPALGESVTEGTVTRWLKQVGDTVTADEPLLEVSTDKVDTEIPAPASGVLLRIDVAEDETVAVGAALAVIGEASEASAAPAPAAPAPVAETVVDAAPVVETVVDAAPVVETVVESPAAPAPAAGGASTPVLMPALGESVTEGTVTRWLKQVGDTVAADEPLLEVSTDKVDTEIPAPASGVLLSIDVAEDATVEVGAQLAVIGAAGAAPAVPAPAPVAPAAAPAAAAPAAPAPAAPASAAPAPTPSTPAAPAAPAATAPAANADAYVTPLVRRLAAQHGVDLSTVTGTGVGGRIRKSDVLDAALKAKQATPAAAAPAASPAAAQPAAPAAPAPAPAASAALRGRTEKMTRLRKVIAERMVESLQTAAQLTTVVEVDVTRIATLRTKVKRDFEAREGVKLSFLPFFCKAAVEALKQYPQVNATLDMAEGTVTYFDAEHLGVAVDSERGLLVPVIRDAGDLNIAGLARRIADLADRTRTNKLSPDELSGGTFTVTNTGSRGALFDTPIINQPQVAILGTGAVVKRPVVTQDDTGQDVIAIRSMVYLALTYDHRLVDGADAARFLGAIKARLEEAAFEAELGL